MTTSDDRSASTADTGVDPAVPGRPAESPPPELAVPEGLVSAVVHLVSTGAVALGAYTLAELTAVDAVVDFLEIRPSDDVLAEAVRSLAARQLLVAGAEGRVQVRGDLGIALAFQQRANSVLDARATGTRPGEPWRILLLPQPEGIALEIRIDALGVHELGLYGLDDALDRLATWLPEGRQVDADEVVDADSILDVAERTALLTMTNYASDGSEEVAEDSTDLVLARYEGDLHTFGRDKGDPSALVPVPARGDARELIASMVTGAGTP